MGTDLDQFRFAGADGETVRLVVFSLTAGLDPRVEVRDPAGMVVVDASCNGNPSGAVQCSFEVERILESTGTYSILVSDSGANESGGYQLQLERLPPITPPPVLPYNDFVVDTFTPQTDVDCYTLQGTAGTQVRLTVRSRTNGLDPRLEVRDPAGAELADMFCNGNPSGAVQCTFARELTLPATGAYLVCLSDAGANENGTFELSLQCLVGDCPNGPPPPPCGNGVLDDGEDCDAGAGNGTTSCCSGTCKFRGSGETCRPAAGACDVTETCTGTAGSCPADAFSPSSVVCRPSAGVCDVAETCTGTNAACPNDGFAPATTVCRAAAGTCDVAETCTGTSATCPGDTLRPSGFTCRPADGACDVAETCTGTSAACPNDGFALATTTCRAATGDCDAAERCTGSSPACPADAVHARGEVCRPAAGVCDAAEACDGTAKACPADAFQPTTVQCRPAVDSCDIAESCPGTGPSCPADTCTEGCATCGPPCGNGSLDPGETCDASATPTGCDDGATCDAACTACGPSCPLGPVLTVGTAPSYATGTVELPVSLDPRGIGIGALNYTVIAPAPPLAYESCDEGPIPLAVDAEQTCRADGPGAATIAIVNRPTIPVPPLGAGVITTLTLRVTAGAEGSHAVCIVPESVRLGSVDGPDVCTAPPVCGAVEVDGTCAMQGDCNCDGRVNSGDRICLIAKFFDLVPEGTCPCEDCNLSGELNAADAPCITLCAFNRCPATGTDS